MPGKLQIKAHENFRRYIEDTYAGKELLKKHSLDETGIWRILGEDPKCDYAGSHYQPELGIVSGVLRDVVMYGVNLANFWQWGGGGNFVFVGKEIPAVNIDRIAVREALMEEAIELKHRLAEINRQLKKND